MQNSISMTKDQFQNLESDIHSRIKNLNDQLQASNEREQK